MNISCMQAKNIGMEQLLRKSRTEQGKSLDGYWMIAVALLHYTVTEMEVSIAIKNAVCDCGGECKNMARATL